MSCPRKNIIVGQITVAGVRVEVPFEPEWVRRITSARDAAVRARREQLKRIAAKLRDLHPEWSGNRIWKEIGGDRGLLFAALRELDEERRTEGPLGADAVQTTEGTGRGAACRPRAEYHPDRAPCDDEVES